MRIQLASDLHLEFIDDRLKGARHRLVEPADGAEVLVLAGDIHQGTKGIHRFLDWPVPVIYIAGNHEFYNHQWERTRLELSDACAGSNIHFLDNQAFEFNGVRFLGSTMWTDFRLPGRAQAAWMRDVQMGLNDSGAIRTARGRFDSQKSLADHEHSRGWLERELSNAFEGPTVVITHHAPHPQSIHPKYAYNPLNAAFVSDLEPLMSHADLWLHGHVHDSFDYLIGNCRVVANPAGYPVSRKAEKVESPDDLVFENQMFQPKLVIDCVSSFLSGRQG